MNDALQRVNDIVPGVTSQAQFSPVDFLAILQGVTGFLGGVAGGDPFSALGAALGLFGDFALKCPLGSLEEIKGSFKKWLEFGKAYQALEDSSELDFDKLDPGAVPEMMQVK